MPGDHLVFVHGRASDGEAQDPLLIRQCSPLVFVDRLANNSFRANNVGLLVNYLACVDLVEESLIEGILQS